MTARPFQSTPPVKAATARGLDYIFNLFISIHAAREGGDLRVVADKPKGLISIHAAREGGDHTPTFKRLIIFKFQSTPPVKAATNSILLKLHVAGISIHAAREGGDESIIILPIARIISIHAAREGGDL